MTLSKAKVTLDGVPLAASAGVAWQFIGGTQPYRTTFSTTRERFEQRLRGSMGKPLTLEITDARGKTTRIQKVYILHEVASDSPHRSAFVVADKRWQWTYQLVTRDYNMPRKTGDRDTKQRVPVETQVVVDVYDYLAYSLKSGDQGQQRWLARDIVENVLEELHGTGDTWRVESWPIEEEPGTNEGQFTVMGLTLADPGEAALARVLGLVPGADVYVNAEGETVVYDATDLQKLRQYYQQLPPDTYAGDRPVWADRKAIRPNKVIVHYQREIEVMFRYEDSLGGGTSAAPVAAEPYIENVMPTVDPETDIGGEFDAELNQRVPKKVPPGTWVEFSELLAAWDEIKPEGSLPWTFDTIKTHWVHGDLEGVLGARLDTDPNGTVAGRVAMIRQHFRQSFRINRKYMERIRSLRAVRVGLLDPVTGARQPAAVWGQACFIPNSKGVRMPGRGDAMNGKYYRNLDQIGDGTRNLLTAEEGPGPFRVSIVDEELGVFTLSTILPPAGTEGSYIPCNLVNDQNATGVEPTTLLRLQDEQPMGSGMVVEGGSNGIWLDPTTDFAVLLTIVPAAPNNARRYHRETVEINDIDAVFRSEFRIKGGTGPDLHLFVPPGEATARFAMTDETEAFSSIRDILGVTLGSDEEPGTEETEFPGYQIMNQERHLSSHAVSLAAESLASFSDNIIGSLVTRTPDQPLALHGNTSDVAIAVGTAPDSTVRVVHNFPGQNRSISRFALMPESTRQILLGIVPFRA